MKKIILSLAVIFVMSSFTAVNTDVEKVNSNEITIKQIDPEDDCREYSHIMVEVFHSQNPNSTYYILEMMQFDLFFSCVENGREFPN
jgi:hypothetical protein